MSSNIQGMFGRIAGTYDQVNHTLSFNQDIAWRKASVAQLTRDGYVPKKVLDLCAGTGDFALAVKEKSPNAEVVLADFAKPMLVLAKRKAGQQKGLGFVEADALKLPFHDMAFDTAVCGFGVRNLDSLEKGVKEIARVLKPGGRAVVLEFFKPTGMFAKTAYFFYMGSIMPARGAAISKDKAAYEYLHNSAKNFIKVKDFKKLMEDNGFKDVVIEARMLGVAYSVMGVRK
jgi:demethylmenaquinone methyltransferase/2-methoxy-6-polyprenyl-1,4-benzoquinol methylase